jgi:hypothetical protein
MKNGISAGGLFTGAEVIKSPAYRTLFGGLANAPYDVHSYSHSQLITITILENDNFTSLYCCSLVIISRVTQWKISMFKSLMNFRIVLQHC